MTHCCAFGPPSPLRSGLNRCMSLPRLVYTSCPQALRLHLKNTVAQPAVVPPPPAHKPSKQKQPGGAAAGRHASTSAKAKATPATLSRSGKRLASSKNKAAADAFKVAKRNRQAAKAADAVAAGKKRRALGRIGEKRAKEL